MNVISFLGGMLLGLGCALVGFLGACLWFWFRPSQDIGDDDGYDGWDFDRLPFGGDDSEALI